MLLIYIICIIATIMLIIFRKKTNLVWMIISSFVGLAGGFLSCIFIDNDIVGFILFFGWPAGLPMLLAYSNKIYETNEPNSTNDKKK